MSFGLANAPATFQAYINNALREVLDICAVVYLDDILVYFSSRKQHEQDVQCVFELLQQAQLYVKASKCEFEVERVFFLDFIVEAQSVEMKPD